MRKLLFVLALLSSAALHAGVKLPPVFADNMVLQQNADVALWGESKPGAIHPPPASPFTTE